MGGAICDESVAPRHFRRGRRQPVCRHAAATPSLAVPPDALAIRSFTGRPRDTAAPCAGDDIGRPAAGDELCGSFIHGPAQFDRGDACVAAGGAGGILSGFVRSCRSCVCSVRFRPSNGPNQVCRRCSKSGFGLGSAATAAVHGGFHANLPETEDAQPYPSVDP